MNELKQDKVETCKDNCTFCWGETVIKDNQRYCENCQVEIGDYHELI